MTMTAADTIADALSHRMVRSLFAPLERLRSWYRRRRDLKDARDAFTHTLYLDEHLLDDMGVTGEEVRWAASLPLEVNAALALRERAARRRAAEAAARRRR